MSIFTIDIYSEVDILLNEMKQLGKNSSFRTQIVDIIHDQKYILGWYAQWIYVFDHWEYSPIYSFLGPIGPLVVASACVWNSYTQIN